MTTRTPAPVPAPPPAPTPRATATAANPVAPGQAATPVPTVPRPTGPLDTSPNPVTRAQAATPVPLPAVPTGPIDTAPNAVAPGPGTGTTGNTIVTITIPTNEIALDIGVIPSSNVSNNVVVTQTRPGGNNNNIQFNNNGTFGGASTANWLGTANNISYNAITINTTNYSTGGGNFARNGAIYFKDTTLPGFISGSINFKAGGRATQPGFMIAPWDLSFNNQPTRQDAGLGIWRSTQPSTLTQRTQTTINGADNGPSVHGVYVADGALDFFPDYATGNTAGLTYVVLPAAFTDGVARRYIGQIAVNAYANTGPQWSLGWKASSAQSPTWNNERLPGNINISWNANNRVGINNAQLTESFNVLGNVRIQATGDVTNTGIKFADGTFQYTAATGGGGAANIAVFDETTLVTSNVSTFVFQGAGVSVGQVGGDTYVEIPGASGDTVYNLGNVTGTTVVDISNGTIQTCTLTGNVFFNLSSVTSGQSVTLLMTQGTGGNKFATYGGTVYFAAGYKTLSTAAGAVDMLNIVNIGGNYYATLTVGYAT